MRRRREQSLIATNGLVLLYLRTLSIFCDVKLSTISLFLEGPYRGTIQLSDYNEALTDIGNAIQNLYTTDIWKLECPTESSTVNLVCYRNIKLFEDKTEEMQLARIEYRVTFSDSYGVPILLFRGSFQDGRPVPLSYFWQCYIKHSDVKLQETRDLWSVISQIEHKESGVPYFSLHPCKTAELMRTVNTPTVRSYLTFWLSFITRYFNIHIPPFIVKP